MGKALVIVESPAKIKTIRKFLGPGYSFESSVGHIRDLPQKEFGIDVEHDFEPKYVTMPDKKDVIKKLQEAAAKVDIVYLAPDPDREGEAIAWHIASILPKKTKIKRTAFQSITKDAVEYSLAHPRDIDMDLVHAQQARRLLDRIVGYKISPILTRRVKRGRHGTSAGRVQSVALKLVVDREKEIEAFQPVEYWNLGAVLEGKSIDRPFLASLYSVNNLKVEKEKIGNKECFLVPDAKTAGDLVKKLKTAPDQKVEFVFISAEILADPIRVAAEVGRTDPFVGFLRGFFRGVDPGLFREVFGSKMAEDIFSCAGNGLRRDVYRVGSHIRDETFGAFMAHINPFVQALRDAHRSGYGKSIMAAGFLLESGGDEWRDRIAFALFFLYRADMVFGRF